MQKRRCLDAASHISLFHFPLFPLFFLRRPPVSTGPTAAPVTFASNSVVFFREEFDSNANMVTSVPFFSGKLKRKITKLCTERKRVFFLVFILIAAFLLSARWRWRLLWNHRGCSQLQRHAGSGSAIVLWLHW